MKINNLQPMPQYAGFRARTHFAGAQVTGPLRSGPDALAQAQQDTIELFRVRASLQRVSRQTPDLVKRRSTR